MKAAKKLIVVILALGLVLCLAATAFAEETDKLSLNVTRSTDGKTLVATLYAHDYIGLTSGKIVVDYAGLTLDSVAPGAQAKAVNDTNSNAFTYESNTKTVGKIIYGFHFQEEMWDAATFAADAGEDPVTIDTANFDLAVFRFTVDPNAAVNDITVNLTSKSGDVTNDPFTANYHATVEVVTTSETTAEPCTNPCGNPCNRGKPCESTTCPCTRPCQKPCEVTTCCCQQNCQHKVAVKTDDGGKDTGDNNVLAVMAGVIALAGAAVVVTRKKKVIG